MKEKEIWAAAGITPAGRWYRSIGQGMGEAIMMATEERGLYPLRSGYLQCLHER